MPEDEQVSPEEKLLNVIQNGGDEEDPAETMVSAAPAPDATLVSEEPEAEEAGVADTAVASASEADTVVAAADKPKLRLAEQAPVAAFAEEPGDEPDVAELPMVRKSQPVTRVNVTMVNRALVAVIAVILSFAAFEIWANVAGVIVPKLPPQEWVIEQDVDEEPLPSLADLLKAFEARPFLQDPKQIPQTEPDPDRDPQPPTVGWRKYAKDHLDLIGISRAGDGWEAIVSDRKENNKLYFLTVGMTIKVSEREITTQKIDGDQIILTDGKDTMTLK